LKPLTLTAVASFFLFPISGDAYFGVAQRVMLATFISWQLTISLYAHRTENRRQTTPEHGNATQLADSGEQRGLAPQPGISAN